MKLFATLLLVIMACWSASCTSELVVRTQGAATSTDTALASMGSKSSASSTTSSQSTTLPMATATATATNSTLETVTATSTASDAANHAPSTSTETEQTTGVLDTTPPGAFAITAPQGLMGTDQLIASWQAADGAEAYSLVIASNSDCSTTLQTYDVITTTTQVLASLSDGNYFICVDARDAVGNVTSALSQAFTIDTTPPTAFAINALTTPSINTTPTIAWNAASGASAYALTIATANDCSSPQQSYPNLTQTSTSLGTLTDGTYYACVEASDAAGNQRSASNNAYAFVVDTTSPALTLGPRRVAGNSFTIRPTVSDISTLTYSWSQVSGPGTVTFGSPNSKDTMLTASAEGDYVLRLTATDQVGLSSSADVGLTWDRAVMVSAARHDTCAIKAGGQLYCWGRNNVGGLGNGNTFMQKTPQIVSFGAERSAISVSVGSFHTCAILDDASSRCWGPGSSTGYGDTSTRLDPSSTPPLDLGNGRTAQAISSGFSHSCALLDDGSIKCWGANSYGKLGYGDTTDRSAVPTTSINLGTGRTGVKIASGEHFNCALLDNGTVKCWGSNSVGQLGTGDTADRSAPPDQPVALPGALTAKDLDAGRNHACAILSNDTIACWGSNGSGQLGDRTVTNRTSPVLVSDFVGTPKRVTLGTAHSCALRSDGSVSCWGINLQVNGAGKLDAITACSDGVSATTIACTAAGGVWLTSHTYDCSNGVSTSPNACTTSGGSWGSCSDGTKVSSGTCAGTWDPSKFAYCSNGTQSAALYCSSSGGSFAADGYCRDASYQHRAACLTAGSSWHISRAPGPNLDFGTGRSVLAIDTATNGSWSCAVLDNMQVKCWGDNTYAQLGYGDAYFRTDFVGVDLGSGQTALSVTTASNHTCALTSSGAVKCWGNNTYGKLGTGDFISVTTPTTVSLAATATQISASAHHTCAVLSTGAIQCWGNNSNGRLGNGTAVESATPVTVSGLAGTAVEVAAGLDFTCARLNTGAVQCWGNYSLGRLGIGTATVATPCSDGIQSSSTACTSAGGVWNGHLYYDCSNGISTSPAACQAVTNGTWAHCSNGTSSTSALCTTAGQTWDASLYTYCTSGIAVTNATTFCTNNGGSQGSYGYCADTIYKARSSCLNAGKTWHVTTLPGAIVDFGGVPATQIVTSGATACALLQGGSVRCWGSNGNGQIGNGDADTSSSYLAPATAVDFSGHTAKKLSKSGNLCAILDDDSVRCWGSNAYGQTGLAATTVPYAAPSATPVDFGPGRSVVAVAGDGIATCFAMDDGTLRCVGNLGINDWWSSHSASFSLADALLTPLSLGTTSAPSEVAITGSNYCFIAQTDGVLRCSGSYLYGMQGQGLPTFRLLPPTASVLDLGP